MPTPWPNRPKPFDVVWCWFPEVEAPGVPGPKPRPALILGVSGGTSLSVLVAFATSQKLDRVFETEYLVSDPAIVRKVGCSKPTKFDLSRTVWLPYTDEAFGEKVKGSGSPVIGRLELPEKED